MTESAAVLAEVAIDVALVHCLWVFDAVTNGATGAILDGTVMSRHTVSAMADRTGDGLIDQGGDGRR